MKLSSSAKALSRLIVAGALFSLLGAATCDGFAHVYSTPFLGKGNCVVDYNADVPRPAENGDVMQLADSENVNDFIQCHVTSVAIQATPPPDAPPYTVGVSPEDAAGHDFVDNLQGHTGRPGLMVNLSR